MYKWRHGGNHKATAPQHRWKGPSTCAAQPVLRTGGVMAAIVGATIAARSQAKAA